MAGKVLEIETTWSPDNLACEIAKKWHSWNSLRADWIASCTEIRQYVYATDTRKTTNSKNPWKNTTTIPKLCQIRDNLFANYMAALFPKRKWLLWDAESRDSNTKDTIQAITGYMGTVIGNRNFKDELSKCIQDYIDTGNCFIMPEWIDQRVQVNDKSGRQQVGYVGPQPRRINPMDIVFNPVAPSFDQTPKIVRSLVSLGEVKDMLESMSTDDNRQAYEELYTYMKTWRTNLVNTAGELTFKDEAFSVDGFSNYRLYLDQNVCEVLTFYGDIYDRDSDKFLKNHVIMVVDRHKIIQSTPNPSVFGTTPIRHVGWRTRQDNLWAMGPLANLVGMQYRIDHMENTQADVLDLIAFPPLKIKGFVQDFEWGPFSRIVTDEEGDVEMMHPDWQVLQLTDKIKLLMAWMEEMAGAPKEAMGFRTPGEKTKYEVQRQENAAGRIFTSKTNQFEEHFVEPHLNDLLELARRKVTSAILTKYWDDDLKITKFLELSPSDLSGSGRIVPFAARHFAEQAEIVQNLTNFFNSPIGQDPGVKAHFSTIKTAMMFEDLFDITDWKLVTPFVRMAEEADAQRLANAQAEQIYQEALEDSGLHGDPVDASTAPPGQPGMPPGQPMQMGGHPGAPPPAPGAPPPTSPFTQGPGTPAGMQ